MRAYSPGQRALLGFFAKIVSLEMLFGGPLVASDDLRPLIGQVAAVAVAIVPVVMFYVGASALASDDPDRSLRRPLRIGVAGAWLVAPMNAYAIARVLAGDIRFGAITIVGVLICTLVIVGYLILAGRALRDESPTPDAP
ncbi:MAG TPA: hypothetical protein VJY35_02890 [Candidatus Eisenbacteria bacterium]|nr:hypothetical protein [Candidatus Eisenbacteria bacterium]